MVPPLSTPPPQDIDRDGRLSEADFVEAVQTDMLLLEALGPCLPSDTDAKTFLDEVVASMP
eukprot:m.111081 g.111081  ORF g.111081 m.111081 type:complete len:61 (+) comp13426_c0_seq4:700-882(+)